jgi:hypothetical protein
MNWAEAGVLAETLGSLGIVFTLFYSVWSFTTTIRDGYYAELDRVYFELLKIGLERPELLTFQTAPDPAKAREYNAYAFMVWNFIETIYDRCQGWSKRRLRETWYPIIASENAAHRQWFDLPENRCRFKQSFVRFIEADYPVPGAPLPSPGSSGRPSSPTSASR